MDAVLIIEIKNSKPLELLDLTKSLVSLANNFSSYIGTNGANKEIREAKLYVKEIRSGSVIIELIELISPALLPFVENTNALVDFANHFKGIVSGTLQGNSTEQVKPNDLKEVIQILNPIANDTASQFNLSTKINGNVSLHFHIDSNDSNAFQNIANRKIKELKEPVINHDIENKVILTLYQARNDIKSSIGNKGIIESISPKALNIIFENDYEKEELLHGENPFLTAFVVDIQTMFANNKPIAYKIIKLHEQFEIEE